MCDTDTWDILNQNHTNRNTFELLCKFHAAKNLFMILKSINSNVSKVILLFHRVNTK